MPALQRALFPVSLVQLAAAEVLDLIDLATDTGAFYVAAYWLIAGGVVAGVAAALSGLAVPARRPAGARRAAAQLLALVLLGASWLLRQPERDVPAMALALALGGFLLLVATSWVAGARWRGAGRPARTPGA